MKKVLKKLNVKAEKFEQEEYNLFCFLNKIIKREVSCLKFINGWINVCMDEWINVWMK